MSEDQIFIDEQDVELLAIKLYEHDHKSGVPVYNWMFLSDEDRDIYRRIARGQEPYPVIF